VIFESTTNLQFYLRAMNKRFKTVMSRLKPKVKAFGFNQKELKGVAAKIADNLTLEEDASDEDINAAIDEAIDAVIPYLEAGRSYANRVINDSQKNGDEDDDDEEDEEETPASKQTPKQKRKPAKPKDDEEPDYFKKLRESIEARFAAIEGARTTETRKGKLEKLLKDSGTFGKQIIKGFSKMKFETDDEFDEYLSEVEEDLKSYNQELADKGLGGTPPGAGNGGKGGKDLPELTDAEIDDIVDTMP